MLQKLCNGFWLILAATFLAGCDQLAERAGMPDPEKIQAEGKAIGGACRHAGRGLEDCYRLNKDASKSAVYAGWKEMNEYMIKNNMQAVEPSIPPEQFVLMPKRKKKSDASASSEEGADADTTKKASHDNAAADSASKKH